MKFKGYYFLFFFIIIKIFITKTEIINDAFPFYPYEDILEHNFEDYCLNMNLKKDCIIEYLSKIDISNIKNISYDFLKTNYENQNNNPSILGEICSIVLKGLFHSLKNNIIGFIGSTCIDLISSVKDIGKKLLNEESEQIILEVEKLLKNGKYQMLVNEWLKKDMEELIEKSIYQLDKYNYIKDFFRKEQNSDKHINLDSKFNANVNSLNFIIFGNKGVGKSKFINNILDLESINYGPNGKDLQLSPVKFTKYKNDEKKGIELIEAKGDNTTDFNRVLEEFDTYFYDRIIYEENNFIYGFIYLNKNNDTLALEDKDLINLYEYHYGKIPYKIIRLKNDNDYNDFINFILKELNENKLKDIYKYYYSLNVFKILINKIILTKKLVDIFSSLPKSENSIKDADDVTNITISKLKLDINTLLLRPKLNYENISKNIKKLYTEFINELNEDFEKLHLDYTLEVEKSFSFKNFFIENHPNDIIPIFFYEKIRILLEEIFFNAIKNMTINYSFSIEKYPDYLNILDNISKNFIISQNNYKNWNIKKIGLIIIGLIIIFIIILIIRHYKRNKTEKNEGTELENLDPHNNNQDNKEYET